MLATYTLLFVVFRIFVRLECLIGSGSKSCLGAKEVLLNEDRLSVSLSFSV